MAKSISSSDRPDVKSLARFTINLEAWWRDKPFMERVEIAAAAGFQTAEMWSPVKEFVKAQTIRETANAAGIRIIHWTLDVPNFASTPADQALEITKRVLEDVLELQANYATIVGHSDVPDMSRDEMLSRYQDRLAEIAPLLEEAGIIGTVEPFNPYDHPGHFLYGAADAVRICREIGSPNLKMNWDLFHMQRAEGNVVYKLLDGIDQCALIQIADSPYRAQPGTGEMNYAYILNTAIKAGFRGPIGLECFPDTAGMDKAVSDIAALGGQLKD